MAAYYVCGASLSNGQGVRRNVRTGISIAGPLSGPSLFLLILLSDTHAGKSAVCENRLFLDNTLRG